MVLNALHNDNGSITGTGTLDLTDGTAELALSHSDGPIDEMTWVISVGNHATNQLDSGGQVLTFTVYEDSTPDVCVGCQTHVNDGTYTAVKVKLEPIPTNQDNNYKIKIESDNTNDSSVQVSATIFDITTQKTETFTTAAKAEINTEADTALSDIGLDHLISASVTGTDITDNSIIAKLVSKESTADWDDFVNTTDSLQALRDVLSDILIDTSSTIPSQIKAGVELRSTGLDNITFSVDGATISAKTALQVITRYTQGDMAISGTTLTVSDADGTIDTFTLNDGTNPTSRTRD